VLVRGRLERYARGGGAINLLAVQIDPLRQATGPLASVTTLRSPAEAEPEDFVAVAPPVTSFAQGRRR
jgi:hypothetical protein